MGSGLEIVPRAGVDYPATFAQLTAWFATDAACREYLARVRWPEGFCCPVCTSPDAWQTSSGLWLCQSCRRKTSVTAGTIFHRSKLPLTQWFAAAWFVCAQKNGVSALGLQRVLGLGSYRTAWSWMHKLRRAMVRPERDLLDGLVELDETFVGGRESGVDGRQTFHKAVVAIAVEILEPKGFGRVRLAHLRQVNAASIRYFATSAIEPAATIRTDGWNLYPGAFGDRWTHKPIAISRSGDLAHVALPGVHRVASLLKRWLAGTLHSGNSAAHLDYYLDEFTFRFNRRNSRSRGLLFYRLIQQATQTDPHPYRDLVGGATSELDDYIWG